MRTRFLNVDYFNSASVSALEALEFLRLPLPQLPPSENSKFEDPCCFDDVSVRSVSLEIERFPIDEALSKFLSDVLPHHINAESGALTDAQASSPKACFDRQNNFSSYRSPELRNAEDEDEIPCEEMELETQRNIGSETMELDLSKKENEITFDCQSGNNFKVIQFEIPEIDLFGENASFLEKEEMHIFSEVLVGENVKDMLNQELNVQYPFKIQDSVYSIVDVIPKYHMQQKAGLSEDEFSFADQFCLCHGIFPLFEVDEISLGISSRSSISLEDEFLQLLVNIELQDWSQINVAGFDGMELLGSINIDIFDCFLSKHCLEYELAWSDVFLKMDLLSIIELLYCEENSAFHPETTGENSVAPGSLSLFEDIQFLDLDSSGLSTLFPKSQKVDEPEICELIFRTDMDVQSFEDLIVSNELVLVDDFFRSLPVPILSDHDKMRSLHVFVEEVLTDLKPQSLSASDGIYLDWNLLENDKWGCNNYSYQNILERIDNYNIDSVLKSFNDEMLVLDFVFSGDTANEQNMVESREMLNIPSTEVSGSQKCPQGVALWKNDGCQGKGDVEVLTTISFDKTSLSMEKRSQFDNFFLDPHRATKAENSKPAVEVSDIKAAFPIVSSDRPIPACATSTEQLPQICTNMHSFPDSIIIVNTKNFEKEMIISRRSTYQKILAMEKEGAQVVERDLNLPVDVIVSAAVCLTWYDHRNIAKKATVLDEDSSCLPLCIENIAANVLMSLSFAFSSCIMIFEGDSSFLAAILESSDELYAAAASLGIDIQLFCSYSSELTDEIILSCIELATKLTKGLYPQMPESETLAESFLTTFPSINPLSAHVILSSGVLVEFLKWSHEHRICAIRKYHVPDESIALMSVLCRYGEREDSKSGMTDCSSSVSSASDSKNCNCKDDSGRKRRKCVGSSFHKFDIPMDDLLHFDPLKKFTVGNLSPRMSKQYDSWTSEGPVVFDGIAKPNVSFDEKFFEPKKDSGLAAMTNTSRLPKPYDSRSSRRPELSDEIIKPGFPSNDIVFGKEQGLEMNLMNKLDWHHKNNFANLQKFAGEVLDINYSSLISEDLPCITSPKGFSPSVPEKENDHAAWNSKTAGKLSFNNSSLRTFPTAAEISCDTDMWISAKDEGQSSSDRTKYSDKNFGNNKEMPLQEGSIQKTAPNFDKLSFHEKDAAQFGDQLLSNAVRSAQAQRRSPWMIELVNRARERSRLRQQSLTCHTSPPCFENSGNISKFTKRKSPSILDLYKYQPGSTPNKILERQGPKRCLKPSNSSKNEKTSASLLPTWTPLDKRARRTLSFATSGSGGQSKLVWSDQNGHTPNRRS